MGSIWRAQHITLDCPCAVKFIDEKYAESHTLRVRFEREARAAAKLRSRHVVQIMDYGLWRGIPYIAMELLEGETLAERLERVGRISPEEALSLMKGVARALHKAAALDIVHRDLKPENIFIVSDGKHEYPKVLDFGIAKLRDPNLIKKDGKTKTGAVLGTPFYMSPEQADGTKEVDYRSDLWAFGVIVYECLTGDVPFYSEAFGNLVLKITNAPLPVPSQFWPDLPKGFDHWWRRAADRDRERRFQDAEAMYDALFESLIDPRQSLSGWPALRVTRTSWVTPRSLAFSSARPDDSEPPAPDSLPADYLAYREDSLPPLESDPAPSSARPPRPWTTPHPSARPGDSDEPPASMSDPPPPSLETFNGQANAPPGSAPSSRRGLWAVLALAAVAAVGVAFAASRGAEPAPSAAAPAAIDEALQAPATSLEAPSTEAAAASSAPSPEPAPVESAEASAQASAAPPPPIGVRVPLPARPAAASAPKPSPSPKPGDDDRPDPGY
jgi:serine/threonine-protein kinase